MLWAARPVAEAILAGDLLFGNLETPVSKALQKFPRVPGQYHAPMGIAAELKCFGFDVINLAHGHIYDFGAEGVACTLDELDNAALAHIGIGRDIDAATAPAVVTARNGTVFGFLGYTTMHNALDSTHEYVACFPAVDRVRRDVAKLRRSVDVVVVSCHTGAQYNPYPSPEIRKITRAAIGAGASVYLGHHPHVPQGWERIEHGLALYSLGDFLAPVQNEQTRRTYFARIPLTDGKADAPEIVPCYITDDCRTTLAEGELGESILRHIAEISQAIADGRSDRLHCDTAASRFWSQYVRSWIDEFRCGGPAVILRKFKKLRRSHFQLMWHATVRRLARLARRRRPTSD